MSSGAQASTTAVIAAAGSGERLGAGGPKAFVPLAGRPLLEWSLDAFRAAGVAAIVVAVPPGVVGVGPDDSTTGGGASCPVDFVAGGATRAGSVSNALEAVDTELVAIHDAARPLVMPELIAGVLTTLESDPDAAGAIAAAPLTDTIKRIAGDPGPTTKSTLSRSERHNVGLVVGETLDREELWAAQTPQVFRVGALRDALAAHPDPDSATDEATLVEANGGRVLIHPSPAENLKVTTPLDLRLAEQLLAST